jgi:hypothetical protein
MVLLLSYTTLCGIYMVVFFIFITSPTRKKTSKKLYGKSSGKIWWGQKNPKVTFHTINDHVFEKKRLLLQYHDENAYHPTMMPNLYYLFLWY